MCVCHQMFLDQTKVFLLIWLMYPFIPTKPKQSRIFSVILPHKLLTKVDRLVSFFMPLWQLIWMRLVSFVCPDQLLFLKGSCTFVFLYGKSSITNETLEWCGAPFVTKLLNVIIASSVGLIMPWTVRGLVTGFVITLIIKILWLRDFNDLKKLIDSFSRWPSCCPVSILQNP